MAKVKEFESDMGINIKPYSGKAPKGWREDNWTKVKNQTAKGFKSNNFPVLAATKSFGMGIDKPNVRYTMHMGLPHSIEQFYQEAGRAGRDRRHAESILVYSCKDTRIADHLLSPETSPEEVASIVNTTKWADKDDVINALWFHCNSFQGRSQEFEVYNALAQKIPNLNLRDTHKVSLERGELEPFEKVLHRLTILGVVSDYTIEYKKNEFTVDLSGADQETILDSYKEYIAGYNRGRVADEVAKLTPSLSEPILNFIGRSYGVLIEFIYETIEKGRRRGLREMVTLADNAANSADQSSQVREKILAYLQTAYNEEIEDILNETNTIENLRASILGKTDPASGELLGGLQSPIQSRDMRGQVGRYLESYPDHPGLLLLRGISELFCTDFDVRDVIENIQAGLSQASAYGLSDRDVKSLLCQAVLESSNRFPGRADTVAALLLDGLNDVEFGRELLGMPNVSPLVVFRSAQFLLNKNTQKAKTLV